MNAWVRDNVGVYFGNATAARDLRTQMRGSRGPLLFTAYLGVLILVTAVMYQSSVPSGSASIVQAQNSLVTFFEFTLSMLAVLMHLAGPALTATAVVSERQRRSLDLLFSAPIRPRYFLVGKMIASYRTLWLLLVLSLPITSVCVVLGGATWGNVLEAYLLLSLHGLIFTALSLLASCLANRPAGAFSLAFVFVIGYTVVTSVVAAISSIPSMMVATREMPFSVTLSSFMVPHQLGSYGVYDLFGWSVQIPNWVLFTVFALLVCKLCLLATSSILSPYGSSETASLRRNGLLYFAALAALVGSYYSPALASAVPRQNFWPDQAVGMLIFWSLTPLILFLPHLACFGIDGERCHWPDGAFRPRRILLGTPSGGLPYLLLVLLVSMGALLAAAMSKTYAPRPVLLSTLLLTVSFWMFAWAVGRAISATKIGVRSARTLTFTVLLAIVVAPFFLLLSIDTESLTKPEWSIWAGYPLWSVSSFYGRPGHALLSSAFLLIAALGLFLLAQRWTRKRFPSHVLHPDEP